jgi:type II secretory pathway component PulF
MYLKKIAFEDSGVKDIPFLTKILLVMISFRKCIDLRTGVFNITRITAIPKYRVLRTGVFNITRITGVILKTPVLGTLYLGIAVIRVTNKLSILHDVLCSLQYSPVFHMSVFDYLPHIQGPSKIFFFY